MEAGTLEKLAMVSLSLYIFHFQWDSRENNMFDQTIQHSKLETSLLATLFMKCVLALGGIIVYSSELVGSLKKSLSWKAF